MEIKRLSKYSNIEIIAKEGFQEIAIPSKIIQVATDENFIACEYITKENIADYLKEQGEQTNSTPIVPVKTEKQKALENALTTVLNKDPFGKWGGHKLKDIFDAQDYEWVDRCLNEMQNKFIRDKVQLIMQSGYGGDNE